MGPKNRGYVKDKPKGLLRDYKLFAISCEGGKREPDYFHLCELMSNRIKFDLIIDPEEEEDIQTKSSPEWVLKRALNYIEEFGLNEDDSLWFVLDIDRWQKSHLQEIIKLCKGKKNWNIALSNPCFEVWLYLHKKNDFSTYDITISLKQAVSDLEKGGYNPLSFISDIKIAMNNAKAIDKKSRTHYPEKFVSKVYNLFQELFEFVSEDAFKIFIEKTIPEKIIAESVKKKSGRMAKEKSKRAGNKI